MKVFKLHYLFLGLAIGLFPLAAQAKLGGQNNILGKFFVSNIKGKVTCVVNSRIYELKKGDTMPARGAIVDTGKGANATLIFSNGTGVYVDEKTHFEVKRFEQEFFAPNNNLRVEPSNSLTLVSLSVGRVVLSTPQLLSGTIMIYETPHASVNIRGEKLLIEVNDKQTQTHVAMIGGVASVVPRGADGNFLSIGKRVTTGREAYVTYAMNNSGGGSGISDSDPSKKPAIQSVAEAQAGNASGNGYLGPKNSAPVANGPTKTVDGSAKVLSVIGNVSIELPGASGQMIPKEGDVLPKGTVVKTEAASELYFAPYQGVIATLRPEGQLEIEKISLTSAQGALKKQTAVIKLKNGTLVSMIDPTFRDITDYGVRTPKGIAHANGTAFSVTVQSNQVSVTTTADTVTFATAGGQSFAIKAGNVVATAADGTVQPPVSLSQAIVSNPSLAPLIQNAVTTVSQVVQHNVGGLSNDAALNLLTKVLATASAALPAQTVAFTNQALNAVSATTSSTASNVPAAVSAVLLTATGTTPAQAVDIAAAAAAVLPAQATVIAAAVAKAAPASAAQSAAAVVKAVTPTSTGSPSQSTIQQAAAIAAAATSSAPNQAAPVAAAVMQAITSASPQATTESHSSTAATIASGVTNAAPNQAVPVASVLMKAIVQASPDAAANAIAQGAAVLAGAITTVVPNQSQEVATAVMQGLSSNLPGANSGAGNSSGATTQAAGLVAATVNQIAPGNEQGVASAIASAIGSTADVVSQSAQQAAGQIGQIANQVQSSSQAGQQASAQGGQASQTVASTDSQISSPGWASGAGLASNSGNGGAGNGNGGSGSGNGGAGGSSSNTASNGGSGNGANGAGGSGSGGAGGNGGSSSGTAGLFADDGGGGGAGGGSSNGAGGSGSSGATGAGGTGGGAGDGSEKATSIIVIQFDPSLFDDVVTPLTAAVGTNTWIPIDTGAGSPPDINPIPTTPAQLPPDTTASTAVINGNG